MKTVWERIDTWLRANAPEVFNGLRPGATEAQIAEAEAILGVGFPEDFRASYLIHDGQLLDAPGLIDAWEFLSLERICDEWKVWKDLLDRGDFRKSRARPEPGVRDDWWNAHWIPLTYSGAGDHHSLDLDPAPGGTSGQIILMWHDSPERPRIAPGFRAWLEGYAANLAAGLFAYSEDAWGLIPKDELDDYDH